MHTTASSGSERKISFPSGVWLTVTRGLLRKRCRSTAALGALISVTSTVAVGHAGAAQVTLEGLPAQAVADAPQNVSAVVRDSFRNVVTDYAGTLRSTTTDAQA